MSRVIVRGPFLACALVAGALFGGCDGVEVGNTDGGGFDALTPVPDGAERCSEHAECDDGSFCSGAERCAPSATDADALGCVAGPSPCTEEEMCLEEAATCRPACAVERDADGDGHLAVECGGDDCDDLDPNRYPGNVEVCDGAAHDEDCSPSTFGFLDADGDGAASNACCNVLEDGTLNCGGDCNDGDSTIHPRAGDGPPLYCDGIDNDCDTMADERCPCVEGETRECGTAAQLGRVGTCRPGTQICSGAEFTESCIGAFAPQEEICDTLDNDCDGSIDEGVLRTYYVDADGDGYGLAGATIQACSPPPGHASNADDCDDARAGVSPSATEVCNGIDDNCSGTVDEGFTATFYRDADGDGFGDPAMSTTACAPPAGYVRVATDCDDTRSAMSPAAVEVCDGLDNNCDGRVDEGMLRTFYSDADGDGWGRSDMTTSACSAPSGYVDRSGDCDDAVASTNPAAPEVCDGADNDCDGSSDEGVLRTFYRDADRDSFGRSDMTVTGCSPPAGYTDRPDDCDDSTSGVNPAAAERCNGVDDNCDGSTDTGCACTDGASRSCGPSTDAGECAYGTETCVSGAWGSCVGAVLSRVEVCNGLDDDCDGMIDDGVTASGCYRDGDGDGYGTGGATTQCRDAARASFGFCPVGFSNAAGDCNDGVSAIRPGAAESCDGVDQNCNGTVDEGTTIACYLDADGDAAGTGAVVQRCADLTRPAFGDCPSGTTATAGDCNDGNGSVRPGGTEVCNGIDDDCNGMVDDGVLATGCYVDGDSDGYGTGAATTRCRDAARSGFGYCPVGYTNVGTDCNDASSGIRPGATETCNGIDDDCDGVVDEALRVSCYVDADSDAHGSGAASMQCRDAARSGFGFCPVGYVDVATDCNDTLASVRPGASEACNGIDDDCDGSVDEGVRNTYYRDVDADGYGVSTTTTQACSAPSGYVAVSGDCDDSNPSIRPGAPELCNGIDDNCTSGVTDEPLRTFYRDVDGDLYGTASTTTTACSPPTGFVEYSGDCNDSDPAIRPGATEACNGVDDDCDGSVDDGAVSQCAAQNPFAQQVSSWACSSGSCVPSCASGYSNCNGSAIDGCEANLASELTCGSCAIRCGTGALCSSGACDGITDLVAGGNNTCIIRAGTGVMVCWGRGNTGELNDLRRIDQTLPVQIPDMVGISAADISMFMLTGGSTVLARSSSGGSSLTYGWGNNWSGTVGDGTYTHPRLPAVRSESNRIPAIGHDHTCGLSSPTGGSVHCWGDNTRYQCGNTGGSSNSPGSNVSGTGSVTHLCSGLAFSCVRNTSGQVLCWGQRFNGKLGDGSTVGDSATPVTAIASGASSVDCSDSTACAVVGTQARCWGLGTSGQLGNGGSATSSVPVIVSGGIAFSQVSVGARHVCGRTTLGQVYCWGYDGSGQLGNGATGSTTTPSLVSGLFGATDIAVGGEHSCARVGTDVYCWGSNNEGQLGLGDNTNRTVPVRVTALRP